MERFATIINFGEMNLPLIYVGLFWGDSNNISVMKTSSSKNFKKLIRWKFKHA